MKRIFAVALVLMFTTGIVLAQAAPKARPSPAGTAEFAFADGKKVTIAYSRPHTKDPKTGEVRKIYGGLVPFDKVWRTGANEATSLKTDVALDINGTKIPAGSYTIYTLPSSGTWKLIVNKQTGQWGTVYDEKQDLARIDMKSSALPAPVEQFTIGFEKSGAGANLNLDWENTRQTVMVKEAPANQDMPVQK